MSVFGALVKLGIDDIRPRMELGLNVLAHSIEFSVEKDLSFPKTIWDIWYKLVEK